MGSQIINCVSVAQNKDLETISFLLALMGILMSHSMGHKVLQRHNSSNMMIHKNVKHLWKIHDIIVPYIIFLLKLKKPILFYALVNLSIFSKFENSEKTLMSHSMGHKESTFLMSHSMGHKECSILISNYTPAKHRQYNQTTQPDNKKVY